MHIYEMAAIFWYFYNGQHWYSISVDTQKTGDPNSWGEVVIWNFSIWCIFTKWQSFFDLFIMANANISFSKCNFPLVQFSPSPHHFILGLVSIFKHNDVSMLKTFMHAHSYVMTLLQLKDHHKGRHNNLYGNSDNCS